MMKRRTLLFLAIVGGGLMLGGQQFVSNPVSHEVVSETPMVPALKPNSSNVQFSYSTTLIRQGDVKRRSAHIRLNQTNNGYIEFEGTPETISALADAIQAYPQALASTPQQTTVNGREFAVENTINDNFGNLGIFLSANAKGFRLNTYIRDGRSQSISFQKEDAENVIASLRDAAAIAQQIP